MERTSTTMTAINDDEDWRLKKNNINRRRTEGEAKKKVRRMWGLFSFFSLFHWLRLRLRFFSLVKSFFIFSFCCLLSLLIFFNSSPLYSSGIYIFFFSWIRFVTLRLAHNPHNATTDNIFCVSFACSPSPISSSSSTINPQMHRQSLSLSGSPSWRVNYQRLKHTHNHIEHIEHRLWYGFPFVSGFWWISIVFFLFDFRRDVSESIAVAVTVGAVVVVSVNDTCIVQWFLIRKKRVRTAVFHVVDVVVMLRVQYIWSRVKWSALWTGQSADQRTRN